MHGNGLWQRVWGTLPLLGRGNVEVTWVEHFGDKANFSGKRLDVTSMLPVETRPNIADPLYTSVFPTMILPRYLFFRVVNKNRGLHFWLRIFGILRIMLDRVEKIRYEFQKILHDFWKILMEYFSKLVLLFGLPNGADSGTKNGGWTARILVCLRRLILPFLPDFRV